MLLSLFQNIDLQNNQSQYQFTPDCLNKINLECTKLLNKYETGHLDVDKLLNDGTLFVSRDSNQDIIPLSTHIRKHEYGHLEIRTGQLFESWLNGIGKKI